MKRRTVLVFMLVITLILSSLSFAYADTDDYDIDYSFVFPDLTGYNWAGHYIFIMEASGGMKGYPDGTFRPGKDITVAEFVKTTVALVDEEKAKTDSHWASGYMAAALSLKIITEEMFERSDWDNVISRENMAVIMERTAQMVLKEKIYKDASVNVFRDKKQISDDNKEYIAQAVARGLINGLEDNKFGPKEPANRAQAATMLTRLIAPINRLTLTEEERDEILGIVERGKRAIDFAPGIGEDAKDYKNAPYEVYKSAGESFSVDRVKIYDKPDHFGSWFYMSCYYPDYLYIFDKNGNQLERYGHYFQFNSLFKSASFQYPITEVAYFAELYRDAKDPLWVFYYNDLLDPKFYYLFQ